MDVYGKGFISCFVSFFLGRLILRLFVYFEVVFNFYEFNYIYFIKRKKNKEIKK